MASLITLKRKIGSIKNTKQITKAMELVSSSKLRKTQAAAQASRAYRDTAYELLARLNQVKDVAEQPLFKQRSPKRREYIVITSNSGLAGAYNSNVIRELTDALKRDRDEKVTSSVITIGNKGMQMVRRLAGVELIDHYPAFGDEPTEKDIVPILNTVIEDYTSGKTDEVRVIYTDFRSGMSQVAVDSPLLPARLDDLPDKPKNPSDMNFEPDVDSVIDQIGARLVQVQIWQDLLESLASEHAMRMVAMKNATDNANDLIDDYTLEYNSARQSKITQEIAEISGGAEAMAA